MAGTRTRTGPPAAAKADRKGIQSLEIGLRMLEALAAAGGAASLKELSQAAGLTPSKAHRYLVSLGRAGFAVQATSNARYDLGHQALKVGLAALSRVDAVQTGSEAVARVVEATGHTAMLAVWSELGPVIIRWLNGPRAVYTTLSTGSVLPAVQSATGRVFTAFLPEATTKPTIMKELSRLKTQGRPIDRTTLAGVRAATRTAGLAQVSGDFIPGLNAAAVPILNPFGEAAVVLTLVAGQEGFAKDALDQLRAVGAEASRALGWSGGLEGE